VREINSDAAEIRVQLNASQKAGSFGIDLVVGHPSGMSRVGAEARPVDSARRCATFVRPRTRFT